MPISPFLVCTRCSAALDPRQPEKCVQCGAAYELLRGDMVSFLQPGANTALDAIDYDAVYSVDEESSAHLYRQCRRFLGDLLPSHTSSYLEIGAGTGLFTLAYLSEARPDRALITDISPKMLDVCRQRLTSHGVEARTEVSYALWDGTARCFADEAYDLAAGFSVLHHILDYPSVLTILGRALSKEGRAVFLEPSLAFHHAMVSLLATVVSNLPADEHGWSEEYGAIIGCWIAENYLNIKYRGDGLALESREDKHIFDEATLREAGLAAGFGTVHVIPFGEENEAWSTLNVYMNQIPIPPQARELVLMRCASMMPGPFFYLAPEERAPSFLVVMEKAVQPSAPSPRQVLSSGAFSHPDPGFRFDLRIEIDPPDESTGEVGVRATGWILGDTDVQYVLLERGGSARFPVAGLRMDVARAMNAGRRVPAERAMCSGLIEVGRQRIGKALAHDDSIQVVAVCSDGARFQLGQVPPDEVEAHFESIAGTRLPRLSSSGESSPVLRGEALTRDVAHAT